MTSTPRKTAAKKAAPRSADQKAEANVAMLEEYRDRAAKKNYAQRDRTTAPYLVRGFEPPIEIPRPDLKKQLIIDKLLRQNRINEAIELFTGQHYNRIVDAFAVFPDGDALLFGMFDEMVEHFNGRGANDVPGGSPAS